MGAFLISLLLDKILYPHAVGGEVVRVLKGFFKGESGTILAEEFNVSRERIRQWKNTFGEVNTTYEIFPEIIEELNKRDGGDPDDVFVS